MAASDRLRLSRRAFLRGAGATLTALAVPPIFARAGRAASGSDPVVVSIFLRGAADGLALVVPHGDPDYPALRPTIGLAPGETLDLDGFYAFHPALAPLESLFHAGDLAVIHAVGSHDGSRSHFVAQDLVETATPDAYGPRQGWLNRWLATQGPVGSVAGITIGASKALSLSGPVETLSLATLEAFRAGDLLHDARRAALGDAFSAWRDADVRQAAEAMFDAAALVADVPQDSAVAYPEGGFAAALRDAAALIRADIGVRALAVDLIGWDHHADANANMPLAAGTLAPALAAFHEDLGADRARTVTLVVTEFGRTAAENGSGGCDHGHGSVLLALGGGVRGGRVLTRDGWPGLAPENLFEGRDLAVTTDFRDVYAEILRRHLGVADPTSILAGYGAPPSAAPGLFD